MPFSGYMANRHFAAALMLSGLMITQSGCNEGNPERPIEEQTGVTHFASCQHPNDLAVHGDYLYVVCGAPHTGPDSQPLSAGGQGNVKVYTLDGGLVADIVTPAGGHRAVVTGQKMFVAHFSLDNVVSVIDLDTLVAETIGGIGIDMPVIVPDALDVSPDGRYVYIGNNADMSGHPIGWLSRYDLETGVFDDWRVAVGGVMCDVKHSLDSESIYTVSWADGIVTRIDVASASSIQQTDPADTGNLIVPFSHGMVFGPANANDERHIYALISQGNRVVRLDDNLNQLTDIPGPWSGFWKGPVDAELSTSGLLFISNFNHDDHGEHTDTDEPGMIVALDLRENSPTYEKTVATWSVGLQPIFLAIAESRQLLFVANNGDGTISRIDISEIE